MSFPRYLLVLLFLGLPLASLAQFIDIGLTCSQHLLPTKPSNPVLIRSWTYLDRATQVFVNGQVFYHPRFSAFSYTPIIPSPTSKTPASTFAPPTSPVQDSPSSEQARSARTPSPSEPQNSTDSSESESASSAARFLLENNVAIKRATPPPRTQHKSTGVSKSSSTASVNNVLFGRATPPPVTRQQSTAKSKYANLDLFFVKLPYNRPGNMAVRVFFQRPVLVYIFLSSGSYNQNKPPVASLRGWKSEGWARLNGMAQTYQYGVHQRGRMRMARYSYVFSTRSRGARNAVNLPQFLWVRQEVKGIAANGVYHVRIAEADGSASTAPELVSGLSGIAPNERCPDKLHDMWRVEDKDGDPFVKGLKWATWHPQYDPCYWCAYDHEHGSSAPVLMNYYPKYGLTEHKRQNGAIEPHNGFKDMVADSGILRWYISAHIQTSSLRRVSARHHTVTMVVLNRATKQIVLELSVKADFGFVAARKAGDNNRFIAMTSEGAEMFSAQMQTIPFRRSMRSMNFINLLGLDERLLYQKPIMLGTYEEWICNLLCTGSPRRGELTFDTEDPITAAKDASGEEKLFLGRQTAGGFLRHVGIRRTVRARNLRVSLNKCRETLGSEFDGGVFYTDAYGTELRNGPGPNNVRQFIRPGFNAGLSGKFQPTGPWLGLHRDGVKMFFEDVGFGVDPKEN